MQKTAVLVMAACRCWGNFLAVSGVWGVGVATSPHPFFCGDVFNCNIFTEFGEVSNFVLTVMNIEIVRCTRADWERVKDIRLKALADAPDAFGSTFADESKLTDEQWIARANTPNAAQFIAYTNGGSRAVGLIVGARNRDGPESTAGLYSMWVAPDARGLKIGSALVDTVKAWVREQGVYERILLDVANDNTAAIRLYESCGFRPTGREGTLPPPREHILEHEMCFMIKEL